MKVVLSSFIESDIQTVSDWTAKESPDRALKLVRDVRAEIKAIATNPFSYQLLPEIGPGRRIAVVRKYVIIFRVAKDYVVILQVAHGMRNLNALM